MARLARAWKTVASRRFRIALGVAILLVAVAAGGLDVARTWYTPDTAAVAVPISPTPSAAPTTAAPPTVAFVVSPPGKACPTLKRKSKKADKAADRCQLQVTHKAKKKTTTSH